MSCLGCDEEKKKAPPATPDPSVIIEDMNRRLREAEQQRIAADKAREKAESEKQFWMVIAVVAGLLTLLVGVGIGSRASADAATQSAPASDRFPVKKPGQVDSR